MYSIRTLKGGYKGERMKVKTFKYAEDMHKFLNTEDNALHWRETIDLRKEYNGFNEKTLKRGTYAWAGGTWHNVNSLDPSLLAHI